MWPLLAQNVMTRNRPYHKNDQARVEQKNYTNVRLWFGYERYDNAALRPLINTLKTSGGLDLDDASASFLAR